MSSKEKRLGILFGSMVAIIGLTVLYRSVSSGSSGVSNNPTELLAQLQSMQSAVEESDLWKGRDSWLDENTPTYASEVIASSTLLDKIIPIIKANRLKEINQELTPASEESDEGDAPTGDFESVSVRVVVEGAMRDIVQCIHKIQTPTHFMGIDELGLEVGESGTYQASLLITHWFVVE